MISFVQVVAAMALGAVVPVTALLAVTVYRIRHDRNAPPTTPEQRGDDGINAVEAVAQIAAARFEFLVEPELDHPGNSREARSGAKVLTLHPPTKKRFSAPMAARSSRAPTHHQEGATRRHQPLLRD